MSATTGMLWEVCERGDERYNEGSFFDDISSTCEGVRSRTELPVVRYLYLSTVRAYSLTHFFGSITVASSSSL